MHLERLCEDMKHGLHGHTHYYEMVLEPRLEK